MTGREMTRMEAKFKAGDQAFIVESNRIVREVQVRSCAGGMYVVKFLDTGGGIKLKEHRLFATREDAEKSVSTASGNARRKTPYDYM